MKHKTSRKRLKWIYLTGLGIVITILIILLYIFTHINFLPSPSLTNAATVPTPQGSGAPRGGIHSTLTTPDGVAITLLSVEPHASKLYFHFQVHNTTQKSLNVIGSSSGDFHFYYTKGQVFTPVASIAEADTATHAALPTTLAAGATSDGWVMFDTADPAAYAHEILYRFGAVPGMACKDPKNQSTCHSEMEFEALVWDF